MRMVSTIKEAFLLCLYARTFRTSCYIYPLFFFFFFFFSLNCAFVSLFCSLLLTFFKGIVRWEACNSLGKLGDIRSLQTLLHVAVQDPYLHSRWRSLWALSALPLDQVKERLVRTLVRYLILFICLQVLLMIMWLCIIFWQMPSFNFNLRLICSPITI